MTSVNVVAIGAPGGTGGPSGTGGSGGVGAKAVADIPVTPGQVLFVTVGGDGSNFTGTTGGAGGFNGGGTGGSSLPGAGGAGGGGGSDVRTLAPSEAGSLASRLIVAAGGGGGAGSGAFAATATNTSTALAGTAPASVTFTYPGPPVPPGGGGGDDFTLGQVKNNKQKGTAKLTVSVTAPGTLDLAGKGLKPVSKEAPAAGEVTLTIKAKGNKKAKLNDKGKAKVTAEVTYTPDGGTPNTEDKKIKLVKR